MKLDPDKMEVMLGRKTKCLRGTDLDKKMLILEKQVKSL